jgi:flagellar protein FlbT
MQEEEANTPARRIYFVIMLMYIDPANIATYAERYQALVRDFTHVSAAMPELQLELIKLIQEVAAGNYYHALRQCRKLFEIENRLMTYKSDPA